MIFLSFKVPSLPEEKKMRKSGEKKSGWKGGRKTVSRIFCSRENSRILYMKIERQKNGEKGEKIF